MLIYRTLSEKEICRALFSDFTRRQVVTQCRRKRNGQWTLENDPFTDEWTETDYEELILHLQTLIRAGGFVGAAFYDNRLKGFVSVENRLFGTARQYLDLTNLHVSEEMRGRGIGKTLFCAAKAWAREHSAKKLYISAHSAAETQAFYQKMGCVEAREYNPAHVQKEPFDCQLECIL